MAFEPRYTATFESVAGEHIEVTLLKEGYDGADEPIGLAGPDPLAVDSSKTESDETTPLRPKTATLKLAPSGASDVIDEIYASDARWRMRVREGAINPLFEFLGPVQKQPTQSLDKFPGPPELTANDGLGGLQDVDFRAADGSLLKERRTIIEWLLFCLRKTGLGLALSTASERYAAGMDGSRSPLRQEEVAADTWIEDGEPLSCFEVLEDLARRKGAFLCQERFESTLQWRFFERRLFAGDTFTRWRWPIDWTPGDPEAEYAPVSTHVKVEQPLHGRSGRLEGAEGSSRPSYPEVAVTYAHGAARSFTPGFQPRPDDDGQFQGWAASGYPTDTYRRAEEDGGGTVERTRNPRGATWVYDGEEYARFRVNLTETTREGVLPEDATPDELLPADTLETTEAHHAGALGGGVVIEGDMIVVVESKSTDRERRTGGDPRLSGQEDPAYNVFAYHRLVLEGNDGTTYYLRRAPGAQYEQPPAAPQNERRRRRPRGTRGLEWTTDASRGWVVARVPIESRETVRVAAPPPPTAGDVRLELRGAVDTEAGSGAWYKLELHRFAPTVKPLMGGDEDVAERTTTCHASEAEDSEPLELEVRTGTGPTPAHPGAGYVPGTDELLGDWKVGPYAEDEEPSGQTAAQLLARSSLREYAGERGEIEATYRVSERVSLVQAIEEGGTRYLPVHTSRDYRRAQTTVTAVEVRQESLASVVCETVLGDEESSGSGGEGTSAGSQTVVASQVGQLTKLRAYLSKHNPLAQLSEKVASGDVSSLPVEAQPGEPVLRAGNPVVIIDSATGRPARAQVTAETTSGDTEIAVADASDATAPVTLDEPLASESGIYFGHRALLQMLRKPAFRELTITGNPDQKPVASDIQASGGETLDVSFTAAAREGAATLHLGGADVLHSPGTGQLLAQLPSGEVSNLLRRVAGAAQVYYGGRLGETVAEALEELRSRIFSGAYRDLRGKPTRLSDFIDDAGHIGSEQKGSPLGVTPLGPDGVVPNDFLPELVASALLNDSAAPGETIAAALAMLAARDLSDFTNEEGYTKTGDAPRYEEIFVTGSGAQKPVASDVQASGGETLDVSFTAVEQAGVATVHLGDARVFSDPGGSVYAERPSGRLVDVFDPALSASDAYYGGRLGPTVADAIGALEAGQFSGAYRDLRGAPDKLSDLRDDVPHVHYDEVGRATGVAGLSAAGTVPVGQLPPRASTAIQMDTGRSLSEAYASLKSENDDLRTSLSGLRQRVESLEEKHTSDTTAPDVTFSASEDSNGDILVSVSANEALDVASITVDVETSNTYETDALSFSDAGDNTYEATYSAGEDQYTFYLTGAADTSGNDYTDDGTAEKSATVDTAAT